MALFVSTDHMIRTRKQFVLFPIQFITIILNQLLASGVSSACFLPCLTRSASRILRRINFVPVIFKFVAFFACLGIAHVGLAYS